VKKNSNTTVLFVSYSFPPNGGSGVQRVYKFVKYLPRYGFNTSVLTSKSTFKLTADSTLLDELSSDTKIIRSLTLDPMFLAGFVGSKISDSSKKVDETLSVARLDFYKNLFKLMVIVRNYLRLPDQYIGWLPFAIYHGYKYLKKQKKSVIIVSLPVYTTALVGYFLSKLTNTPLIIDFRDGWVDDPYLDLPTKFHRAFHSLLERVIVNHAKHLVVYGQWLADIYKTKYPSKKTTVILNGFDNEDFIFNENFKNNNTKIKLVYNGSLFEYHQDFIELLFFTVSNLACDTINNLEIHFAGDIQMTSFDQLVNKFSLLGKIQKLGYLPHRESIKNMLTADGLIFTIPRGDVSSYTSKIFEYLATQKPIISFVTERGCGGQLLKDFGHGPWLIDYDPHRALEIFSNIKSLRDSKIQNSPELLSRIERKGQAFELSKIIEMYADS
jgi:glycosyltransferase involved in cell wall biosynthesis